VDARPLPMPDRFHLNLTDIHIQDEFEQPW
jgi:hypothetical protein